MKIPSCDSHCSHFWIYKHDPLLVLQTSLTLNLKKNKINVSSQIMAYNTKRILFIHLFIQI